MARFSLSPPPAQSSLPRRSPAGQTPTSPPWKWNYPPQDQWQQRRNKDESEDDDFDSSDDDSQLDINDNDDDNESSEEEEEPPHPLRFDVHFGKTRLALSPSSFRNAHASSLHDTAAGNGIMDDNAWNALIHIDKSNNNIIHNNSIPIQSFPPIDNYHLDVGSGGGGSFSTKDLLRGATRNQQTKSDEQEMEELMYGMDRIANLVRAANYVNVDGAGTTTISSYNNNNGFGYNAASSPFSTQTQQSPYQSQTPSSLFTPNSYPSSTPNTAKTPNTPNYNSYTPSSTSMSPYPSSLLQSPNFQPRSTTKLLQLAQACETLQSNTIPHQLSQLQSQSHQSYESSCQGFLLLLQADQSRVKSASHRITLREQQTQKEMEQIQKEKEQHELALQRQRQEDERLLRQDRDRKQKQLEREELQLQQRQQALRAAEDEAEREDTLKRSHVTRAQSLIANLASVREEELQEFDKSKLVSRRRLGFKKIVNGKINTLSHEDKKILEVGGAVVEALGGAEREDAEGASGGGEKVLGMGSKYLLDLLASNMIVRVQADGFNG